jgi:hypothetical protein
MLIVSQGIGFHKRGLLHVALDTGNMDTKMLSHLVHVTLLFNYINELGKLHYNNLFETLLEVNPKYLINKTAANLSIFNKHKK